MKTRSTWIAELASVRVQFTSLIVAGSEIIIVMVLYIFLLL